MNLKESFKQNKREAIISGITLVVAIAAVIVMSYRLHTASRRHFINAVVERQTMSRKHLNEKFTFEMDGKIDGEYLDGDISGQVKTNAKKEVELKLNRTSGSIGFENMSFGPIAIKVLSDNHAYISESGLHNILVKVIPAYYSYGSDLDIPSMSDESGDDYESYYDLGQVAKVVSNLAGSEESYSLKISDVKAFRNSVVKVTSDDVISGIKKTFKRLPLDSFKETEKNEKLTIKGNQLRTFMISIYEEAKKNKDATASQKKAINKLIQSLKKSDMKEAYKDAHLVITLNRKDEHQGQFTLTVDGLEVKASVEGEKSEGITPIDRKVKSYSGVKNYISDTINDITKYSMRWYMLRQYLYNQFRQYN